MEDKRKEQLTAEIELLRGEVNELRQEKAERKRAEEALQESEEKYRSLVENSADGIVVVQGRKIVFANKTVRKASGYSEEELKKLNFSKLIAPSSRSVVLKRYLARMAGLQVKNQYEIEVLTKEGRIIPCEISSAVVTFQGGKAIQAMMRDITERKRAEEGLRASEQNFRSSLDNSPLGIRIVSAEGETLYVNQVILDIYGYSSLEELEAVPRSKRYTPESYVAHQERKEKRKLGKFVPPHYEISIVRKDGEVRHLQVFRREVMWGGKTQFQVIYHDITEQKKAGEELQRSEEKYRALFESKLDGVFVLDAETVRVVLANQAAVEMYGFNSVEEVIGVNPLDSVVPEERERVLKIMVEDMFEKNLHQVNEFRTITKDGKEKWISAVGTRIEYEGKLAGLISFRDITEQKEARNRLEELEALESSILGAVPHAVIGLHERRIVFASEGVEAVFGWKPEELIGKTTRVLYRSEEEYEEIASHFYPVLEREQTYSEEFPCRHKDGRDIVCMVSASRIGESLVEKKVVVTYEDITERKRAEEEIKRRAAQAVLGYEVGQRVSSKLELDELLSEIVTAVCDAFDYYGVMILLVDEEAQRLTMQSIAGSYVDIFPRDLYHAIGEGMTGYAAASGKTQVSGNVSKDPHYVREADEETKSELAVPIKRGQKVIGVLDIQSDEFDAFDETDVMLIETLADQIAVAIENARLYEAVQQELAERKKAEEALRESERHFRALIENSSDIIQIVDSEGIIRYLSPSVQRILGYKPEELIGRPSIDVIHPDDLPLVAKGFEEALQKPCMPVITACRCKHKDGTWRVIEGTGINQLDNPSVNGFIANMHDITERKQAEEELRSSEERLKILFEFAPDAYYLNDLKGNFIDGNKAAEEITGYKREELIGKSFLKLKLLPPKQVPKAVALLAKNVLGQPTGPDEFTLNRKDGSQVSVEIRTFPVRIKEQTLVLGIAHDITERKKAEEALRKSEQNYKVLFESKLDGVCVIDETMKLLLANQAAADMFGFDSLEEMLDVNPFDFIPRKERERLLAIVTKDMFEKDMKQVNEFQLMTKAGKEIWLSTVGARIEYQGKSAGLVSFRDITERKRAEEEIKYQRKYFQSLFESSPEAVVSLDPQNLIVNINPAFEKIFGYTLEDIKGKDIDDCIIPRSRKREGRSLSRRTWEGEVVVAEAVRKKADGGEIPVSILGAPIMIGDKRVGMFAIYRDITERKQAQEQLENSFVDLAETVSRAMESRDPYTSGHQRRVAELARLVGEKMGLDKDRLKGLYIGGLLHDIGKISTPESILAKPGRLSDEEWSLIHAHTKQGYLILKGTNLPWPVADMALHHHERLDGSGYPHGISGDKLSLEVRILGVCDVVEAMSSHRPYRPARSMAEILRELRSGRGTKYDANVVDVMLEIIENGEFEVGGEVSRQL